MSLARDGGATIASWCFSLRRRGTRGERRRRGQGEMLYGKPSRERKGKKSFSFFFRLHSGEWIPLNRLQRITPALTSFILAASFLQAAGAAAVAKPSFAAYGDSANIWGATTNTSGELQQ